MTDLEALARETAYKINFDAHTAREVTEIILTALRQAAAPPTVVPDEKLMRKIKRVRAFAPTQPDIILCAALLDVCDAAAPKPDEVG